MKVAIIGPVLTKEQSGGVAVFDEGLYDGMKENEIETILVSFGKSLAKNNVILGNKKPVLFRKKHFKKISKILKSEKIDLAICSLEYTSGIKIYKKMNPSTFFVQVIHGFPCVTDGKIKTFLLKRNFRFTSKYFDKTVNVSFLSYAINKKIYGISSNEVIPNGCNFMPIKGKIKKDIDFLYVGRLTPGKNIDLVANAMIEAMKAQSSLECCIVGYGDLEKDFLEGGKYYQTGINFLGRKNQHEVREIMQRAKFFISLNPLEPFGIVFLEAALSKCNIISQNCFGAAPIFEGKKYFHTANELDYKVLGKKLISSLENYYEISDDEVNKLSKEYSYKNIAAKYLKLLDH